MAQKKTESVPAVEEKIDYSHIEQYLKKAYLNGNFTGNLILQGQYKGAADMLKLLGYTITKRGNNFTVTK